MSTIGFVRKGKHIGVRELRENLSKIINSQQTYFVTEHGRPVRAVLRYEVLLELLEMLEELKNKALLQEVAQGRKEYQEGGWVPVNRLKKSFQD